MVYKGNDNYYLEATSTNARAAGGGRRSSAAATPMPTVGADALALNTWTYLAVTYDGATLRLYVNGTQVAPRRRARARSRTSTNPLQIGGDSIYGQYFNGLIDEVRVYNVALTAAQIQTDMTTPVGQHGRTRSRRRRRGR